MGPCLTRRNLLLAGAGGLAAQSLSRAAAGRSPNVVLILCDDLGYGDVSSFGGAIPTPRIDSIGRDGIRFTHFYSGNPVCSPSRASLMTGRYPTRVGVPRVLFPTDNYGLPKQETTIAEVLKPKGYRTMCIGKWHLGHLTQFLPPSRGFDEYFGIPYSNDMSPRVLLHNTEIVEQEATLETLTPRYTERAVRFIEQSRDAPFFLYLPHTYPHIPLAASERFRGKSPLGLYGDVISEIDWSVGQVLDALRRTGMEKDTLVLFTSDNGPWFQGSPGRLRGRKGGTWEGGQRVPMLAKFPGRIPPRQVCSGVASLMDVMPTVAALCSAAPPEKPLDGVDIWPLLSARKPGLEREVLLMFDDIHLQCARWKNWKLHIARYNTQPFNPPPQGGRKNIFLPAPELYDAVRDVDESYNVAPEHPEVLKEMLARIETLMAGFPESIRGAWAEAKANPGRPVPSGAVARPIH